jgi:RNA polymerase sigma factor for flagellar operon FliA
MIEQLVAVIARNHRLSRDEAEELASVIKLRMIQDDYAVFRKFRGQCALRTFLSVVIRRMFLDYRNAQWGKWRPSMRSRRHSHAAVQLERLTMRDGLSFDEAYAALTAALGEPLDRAILESLHAQMRRRGRRRFIAHDELDPRDTPREQWHDPVVTAERSATIGEAVALLAAALAMVDPQDRLILEMRFIEGLPISVIARRLQLHQKRLYGRLAALLRRLRQLLESRGLRGSTVLDALQACVTSTAAR